MRIVARFYGLCAPNVGYLTKIMQLFSKELFISCCQSVCKVFVVSYTYTVALYPGLVYECFNLFGNICADDCVGQLINLIFIVCYNYNTIRSGAERMHSSDNISALFTLYRFRQATVIVFVSYVTYVRIPITKG